ncbi:MAG: hypothetical protein H7Y30_17760 [Pyrinomonadaceae bacterium]|nr:hypothetical protein [Pyrinomonadaceae bacterium]
MPLILPPSAFILHPSALRLLTARTQPFMIRFPIKMSATGRVHDFSGR